jgi:hypothetical protein
MAIQRDDIAKLGPDFLCVGAQKAGTGWLYEQLRNHPQFWMPPVKELHYFDRFLPSDDDTTRRSLPLARKEQDRIRIARGRAQGPRDHDFLTKFERLVETQSLDFDRYADLFAARKNSIAGDITPGYSTVSDSVVEKIVSRFPTAKVIFIARDPVERAWSQLSMYVRRGLIDRFDGDDIDQITRHLKRPEVLARSYPSQVVRRWRSHVNADRFRVYFFDDLRRNPSGLRANIVTFLGGDPQKPSGGLSHGHNTKAEKQKLPLTEPARRYLAEFFKAELEASALELGGPAAEWSKHYRL